MNAAPDARKVALITGASQDIGIRLAAGYRQAGYAAVGLARFMPPSDGEHYLPIHPPCLTHHRYRKFRGAGTM